MQLVAHMANHSSAKLNQQHWRLRIDTFSITVPIHRDYSFPRNAEFWHKPQNFYIFAEFNTGRW